ncbi:MAG: hypothetical protein BJ554DRAFT_2763, partial [Olpidium bornovanus]
MLRAMREMLIGGRFTRDMNRRFRTTLLNLAFVRRARKRYSCGETTVSSAPLPGKPAMAYSMQRYAEKSSHLHQKTQ